MGNGEDGKEQKGRGDRPRHYGRRVREQSRRRRLGRDRLRYQRAAPLCEAFARHGYDVGEFGNGSKMKDVANLLVAIHNVASAEAMVLGMKAGLPAQAIFDLVKAGAGNSRVFELRAPMMVKGNYDDV